MTVRGRPPPGDDDRAREWATRPNLDETPIDLEQKDIIEMEADAATPPRGVHTLPGYDLGRRDERMAFFRQWGDLIAQTDHRGAARVLHVVRDYLIEDGAEQEIADAIIKVLAARAGVKLV